MSVDDELCDQFSRAVDHLKEATDRWKAARQTGRGEAAALKDLEDAQKAYDKVSARLP